jgi:pimeloyl-ACP methyl ester carboxylesterase
MADRVRDLHIPVTIMAGTKDRIVDHESHAKWFQEQIPPNCGKSSTLTTSSSKITGE